MGIKPIPIAAALLLAGCNVGPNFERPNPWSPAAWFGTRRPTPAISQTIPAPLDPDWWDVFNDPVMTGLIHRVADANFDVRVATLRIAESRAQRRITRADEFPQVNGNSSYTRERPSSRGVISLFGGGAGSGASGLGGQGQGGAAGAGATVGRPSSTIIPPFNLFQYGFDASWELDLWGRVRRSVESADATIEANAEARRNAILSAIAEVARDYITLRGTQRRLAIQRANRDSSAESLRLTRSLAAGGLGTETDVANAAANLAATEAGIPQLEQQIQQSINQLGFLLGEPPGTLAAELDTAAPVPPVPPRVPIGLPGELAQRRPDIRQAEAQLHSATADIGVARADFYPRVTLSGSLSIQAIRTQDLTNWAARQYAIGPSITIPIFEGGRIRATVDLRTAQQQEAALNYQRTVLQAWHDVDNAMIAYEAEQRRRERLIEAVRQYRQALFLARQRYQQGLSDFLTVLDTQRAVLNAEQQEADSTTTVSTNLVALYKALGGGWEADDPRPIQAAAR